MPKRRTESAAPAPAPTPPDQETRSELLALFDRVPLDSILPDPANLRTHDRRNLDVIKASLLRFGQQEPLTVRRADRMILAGHGRREAMLELGWTDVYVQWSDLDGLDAAAYGITANRSAELAGWDVEGFAKMARAFEDAEYEIADLGWTTDEIEAFGAPPPEKDTRQSGGDPDEVPPDRYTEQYAVIVLCGDEAQQQSIYNELKEQGYNCRVVAT